MLATLIQRYDNISFHFKNERLRFYRLSGAPFYDCINTIYQFINPFLDNKCLFFRDMEPVTTPVVLHCQFYDKQCRPQSDAVVRVV